ncbi:MAG: endonuclease/exonuclease/phosphatase family protein [Candidatus Competibacteraceae bacterium]|nr:endonuclease/exonuclease/phosphatase family protein [Candidatus Competibacteraceae bacterium]
MNGFALRKWVFILFLSLLSSISRGQLRVCTWNIANLGGSKSIDALQYIANTIKSYHLVAIQEVVASIEGPRAVARIDSLLDVMGGNWEFVISNPTDGPGVERYAFIWNTRKVKLLDSPVLIAALADSIDREPFLGKFLYKKDTCWVLNFHAVPTAKKPANEIVKLFDYISTMPKRRWICLGDFNLSFTHNAYSPWIDAGYTDAVNNALTSLKMEERNGERFANSYDHIIYHTAKYKSLKAGIIDFTKDFESLRASRKVSDHVPVYAVFKFVK